MPIFEVLIQKEFLEEAFDVVSVDDELLPQVQKGLLLDVETISPTVHHVDVLERALGLQLVDLGHLFVLN